MGLPTENHAPAVYVNEIPKWGEPYPRILYRQSVLEALTDYILQVNYRGYQPDPRKVLAVRTSDRTATLRNAATPIRQEVYYFFEGEIFPKSGTTRLKEGQSAAQLAGELLEEKYEQLFIWTAYDFTKGSPPGFRKPFDRELVHQGSEHPNPEQITRRTEVPAGVHPNFFLPDPQPQNVPDAGLQPDLSLDAVVRYLNHLVTSDFRNALPEGDNQPIWDLPIVGSPPLTTRSSGASRTPRWSGRSTVCPGNGSPVPSQSSACFSPFPNTSSKATRRSRATRRSNSPRGSGTAPSFSTWCGAA